MWFNIVLANMRGNDAVGMIPIVTYLRQMLSVCGHEVTVVPDQLYEKAVNLFIENFVEPDPYVNLFRNARAKGYKIGVFATELMVDGIIPYARHGIYYSLDGKEEMIRRRIEGFDRVLVEVDFLWAFLERTAQEYSGRIAVCEFMPAGCMDLIPQEMRRAPKDVDVLFFGMATPHRLHVIERLREQGIGVIAVGGGFPVGWLSQPLLDSLLDRAKIGLNLTLHDVQDTPSGTDPRFVSCMRMLEFLTHEVLVVSEDIPHDNPYGGYMVSAPIDALPTVCRRILDTGVWQEMGASHAAHFRSTMDVRRIVAPAIERTLAALFRSFPTGLAATHPGMNQQ